MSHAEAPNFCPSAFAVAGQWSIGHTLQHIWKALSPFLQTPHHIHPPPTTLVYQMFNFGYVTIKIKQLAILA